MNQHAIRVIRHDELLGKVWLVGMCGLNSIPRDDLDNLNVERVVDRIIEFVVEMRHISFRIVTTLMGGIVRIYEAQMITTCNHVDSLLQNLRRNKHLILFMLEPPRPRRPRRQRAEIVEIQVPEEDITVAEESTPQPIPQIVVQDFGELSTTADNLAVEQLMINIAPSVLTTSRSLVTQRAIAEVNVHTPGATIEEVLQVDISAASAEPSVPLQHIETTAAPVSDSILAIPQPVESASVTVAQVSAAIRELSLHKREEQPVVAAGPSKTPVAGVVEAKDRGAKPRDNQMFVKDSRSRKPITRPRDFHTTAYEQLPDRKGSDEDSDSDSEELKAKYRNYDRTKTPFFQTMRKAYSEKLAREATEGVEEKSYEFQKRVVEEIAPKIIEIGKKRGEKIEWMKRYLEVTRFVTHPELRPLLKLVVEGVIDISSPESSIAPSSPPPQIPEEEAAMSMSPISTASRPDISSVVSNPKWLFILTKLIAKHNRAENCTIEDLTDPPLTRSAITETFLALLELERENYVLFTHHEGSSELHYIIPAEKLLAFAE